MSEIGPAVGGPEVIGPEVDGQEVYGSEVDGPEVVGPEGVGPKVEGPEVEGPEVLLLPSHSVSFTTPDMVEATSVCSFLLVSPHHRGYRLLPSAHSR